MSKILFQSEVIALNAVVLDFGPLQFLDGKTKAGEVGYVFGLQVLAEFLLDGGSGPKILAIMNVGGLKEL